MSSEKLPKKKPGYKTYDSTLRNAKRWMQENPKQVRDITQRYYYSHQEEISIRKKKEYQFKKACKELMAIEA
jgi:hypothetical protein